MMNLNKVTLMGIVARTPAINERSAYVRIAINESWKDREGNKHKNTQWIDIAVFGEQRINFVKEHLKTDLRMYIEGKLQSSEFTAEDGSKVQKLEVVGQTFKFVDNKKTASE